MTQVQQSKEKIREAEFVRLPNSLKKKVGAGGLSEEILTKAQMAAEKNTVDFVPLAEMYLKALAKGVESIRRNENPDDQEYAFSLLIYPALQLKSNGGMFRYPLVTKIAKGLIAFLERVSETDEEMLEIVMAFHNSIKAVIDRRVSGNKITQGDELIKVLEDACRRYFDKNSEAEG